MSKDTNLPDNCQGTDPSFPWNEPDEILCPKCGEETEMDRGALHCIDADCDYVDEPDEHDGDY